MIHWFTPWERKHQQVGNSEVCSRVLVDDSVPVSLLLLDTMMLQVATRPQDVGVEPVIGVEH